MQNGLKEEGEDTKKKGKSERGDLKKKLKTKM